MKITEVTRRHQLREAINQDNDTGFLTEDLVRIVEAHESNEWSEPQTADELLAEMDAWDAEYDKKQSTEQPNGIPPR